MHFFTIYVCFRETERTDINGSDERQNEANLVILNSSNEDLLEAVTLEVTLDQNLAEVVVQNVDEVKSDDNEIDLNGSKVDQNTTEENVHPKDLNPEGNNLRIEYLKRLQDIHFYNSISMYY